MRVVEARTLGECWLAVSRLIVEKGAAGTWEGAPTKEIALLTALVERPDPDDATIATRGDPEWLAWMHANFFTRRRVDELGGARSYAQRLFDYGDTGRDQLAWVVERLRANPEARDAAITTFEPLFDRSYIPCVSLLDFWLPDNRVELVVYAHSLDFGKKAYGNLVELAHLQRHVAAELGVPPGRLVVHAKSAHVYEPEWELMTALGGGAPAGASVGT